MVHYSIRLFTPYHFPPEIIESASNFKGLKILFIQDEYDDLLKVRDILTATKFDIIYTCVPQKYIKKLYPPSLFPDTTFITNLTGYISDKMISLGNNLAGQKDIDVFYRGRELPIEYGSLGLEKAEIGKQFRKLAQGENLILDIETNDSERIYGVEWYKRLSRAKFTLATPSGSNVFDLSGNMRAKIKWFKLFNRNASEKDIYENVVKKFENEIIMNQISPKFLEAMCCKTALILFEDNYNSELTPNVHYLSLKKDFSNFEEIKNKIQNPDIYKKLVANCMNDFVLSNRYHYSNFIHLFDNMISDSTIFHALTAPPFPTFKNLEAAHPVPDLQHLTFLTKKQKVLKIVLAKPLEKISIIFGKLSGKEPTYLYSKLKKFFSLLSILKIRT